jgi:tetratricopeptide (TPR) repeat protein
MNQTHQREADLFEATLELPPEQRPAYLDRACAGDAALRQRIEALLKACESSCALLESPINPAAAAPTNVSPASCEKAGDRIGRYKLLQQIGEGGCGVVYMAEQEEPVSRRVALKVIKLGLDTKSVIARFEAERQALALMDHPHIAKVFDAGATENGRPYFVMELVRGMKITDYCDAAKLPTRARLELFIQICQAIQHAHQKGIIHRDIKPSNILVTVNDGVAVPKVIDFGIAKATCGQKLTDKTLFTAFEQFIGTPAYMSPEQATLTNQDIDTRSDIYALGVLLYELLTGKTPFDAKDLLAIGLEEMCRTVRDQDPPRPSTRLSTLPGQELSTTAQRRGIEAPKLISELRGDLDWIVMKALEKDRARRYETANGLAMDIQRHLKNEPVVACPPSAAYRFGKMVRRNKLAFAAGAAVVASLLIGLGVSTWMFFKEKAARQRALAAERDQIFLRQQADIARTNETMLRVEAESARRNEATLRLQAQAAQQNEAALRQEAETARTNEAKLRLEAQAGEKKAEAEAAKSQTVAQFLKDMLQSVRPSVALGRDTTLMREIVDQTAERLRKDLAGQPEVQAELQSTIAEVYQALGEGEKAGTVQREALAVRRASLGDDHPQVARALNDLALILWPEGEGVGAERLRDENLWMRSNTVPDDYDSPVSSSAAEPAGGPLDEVEQLHRQALAIRRKALGNEHLETTESLNSLALVLRRQGKLEEAETLHREALSARKKILAGDSLPIARSLHNLAVVLRDRGKLPEARQKFLETLALRRKLLGTAHADVARTVRDLADVLQRQDDLSGIQALVRDELTNASSRSPGSLPLKSDPLYQLLSVLLAHKQYAQLDRLLEELISPAIQKEPGNVALLRNRAEFHARRGRWNEAAVDLTKVVELDPDTHDPWYFLAPLLLRNGEIEAYRRHCHAMLLRFGGSTVPVVAERTAKACLLLHFSDSDLALATGLAQTAVLAGPDHPFRGYFQFVKGLAEYRLGQYAHAEGWLRQSLAANNSGNLVILARLALTMTCHQLGKTNVARYALVDAFEFGEKSFVNPATSDFGENWHDVLISHILLEEAKALVGEDAIAGRHNVPTYAMAARLHRDGRRAEAETVLRDVVANYKALFGSEHPLLIRPLQFLGHTLAEQGDWSEAEVVFRERLALQEKRDQKRKSDFSVALSELIGTLIPQQKLAEAESLLRSRLPADDPQFAAMLAELTHALLNAGTFTAAEATARECLAIQEKEQPDHPQTFDTRACWAVLSSDR